MMIEYRYDDDTTRVVETVTRCYGFADRPDAEAGAIKHVETFVDNLVRIVEIGKTQLISRGIVCR